MMKQTILAITTALLMAPLAVAMPGQVTELQPAIDVMPAVPTGVQPYYIGFYELPSDVSQYAGIPVTQVDEDLKFLRVETEDIGRLRSAALLDDSVRYVERDTRDQARLSHVPNDAKYNDPGHYGSKIVGAEGAWDVTLGSSAVKVAMLDSGLNKGHEEFAGQSRVLQGYDFYNGDNDPEDKSGSCGNHGTHTTGTAGATIDNGVGIAGMSQHSILPVKIFHSAGGGPFGCRAGDIISAIKYAGDQGAHVSSNSWGGGSGSAYNDAILYSHNKGTIHVAAAGNSGPCSNCVDTPWRDNAAIVIIVSASDSNDGFASYSSRGPEVDIIAPGSAVLSPTTGTNGYDAYDGTSMATPHVAGAVALYLAVNSGASFTQVNNALATTADDIGLSSDRQGSGRLNACDLVGSTTCGVVQDPACSDGIDNDGDGLIDFPADPGCSSASDTDETDPIGGDMHVHSISHSRQGNPRTGNLLIDVVIYDAGEAPVAAANVCINVNDNDTGGSASGCADTGADGTVTFQWGGVGGGSYTTCVTSVTHVAMGWDQAADHASSGSCHTSSV